MAAQWSLLVLVIAVAAGLVTVTTTSVLARSRQTALFSYLQLQVLLFNLVILAGLVVQFIALPTGGRIQTASPPTTFGLLAAMVPLKLAWLYAFVAMTLVLNGQELPEGFRRRYWAGATVLAGSGALGAVVGVVVGAAATGAMLALAGIEVIVIAGALVASAFLVARGRWLPPGPRRRSVTALGCVYLGISALMLASAVGSWLWPLPPADVQAMNGALMIAYNLLPLAWTLRFQPRGPLPAAGAMALFGISPRERDIIALISAGCTNQEVADRLFISLATVKDHNYNIFRKLGVRNRVELVNLLRPDGATPTGRGGDVKAGATGAPGESDGRDRQTDAPTHVRRKT